MLKFHETRLQLLHEMYKTVRFTTLSLVPYIYNNTLSVVIWNFLGYKLIFPLQFSANLVQLTDHPQTHFCRTVATKLYTITK